MKLKIVMSFILIVISISMMNSVGLPLKSCREGNAGIFDISKTLKTGTATLTGSITDWGIDNVSDSKYEFLVVSVEVDVTTSGTFRVRLNSFATLEDASGNSMSISDCENTTYLEAGIQTVQIYIYGPSIFGSDLNPSKVPYIYLYDDSFHQLDEINDIPLSRTYDYKEFAIGDSGGNALPNITVANPINTTYAEYGLALNFTITKISSWIGYSLDGNPNVTITGNTTLGVLSEGPHFIVLFANDTAGNMGKSDTVWFTIDVSIPSIDSPADLTYEKGTTGNTITWQPIDANPSDFILYRNGTSILSGSWPGANLTFSIDGLNPDFYNFTLVVYDEVGHFISDSVFVRVTSVSSPSTEPPASKEPSQSSSGFTIGLLLVSWIIVLPIYRGFRGKSEKF
jgi:hypothetical protein